MTPEEYTSEVLRTSTKMEGNGRLDMCALGLAGEVGEIVDHIKKVLYHGHSLDVEYLKKEMGDFAWYWHSLMLEIGTDYDEVTNINSTKLRKRYPDGFSYDASMDRADES